MPELRVRHEERDPEAVALDVVMHYMNHADQKGRERLMFHLQHKYFNDGFFIAKLTHAMTIAPPGYHDPHEAARKDPGPLDFGEKEGGKKK